MLPQNDRTPTNRRRARSFGAVAELYDRARPSYPTALIDDLVAVRPSSALDIGCGTGQMARLLAARDVAVLGVEPDERMAAVARSHAVEVEVDSFENWDSVGRRFDLIVSGQAWHWLDPVRAPAKAADLLRPGGRLALCWNFADFDEPTRRMLDLAYASAAPQLSEQSVVRGGGTATVAGYQHELTASGRFNEVRSLTYEWHQDYSAQQWLDLISSHSDHSTLPPEQLDELRAAIGKAINNDGGELSVRYVTHALLAVVA